MKRVKQRIFAGVTCDQIIMHVRDGEVGSRDPKPQERFCSEEEREEFNNGRGLRRFIRMVNANFTPAGYYMTLTFDDENEIYSFQDARRLRDNYKRRIRYKHPDDKYIIVMGRGKHTARIHFHMIYEGENIKDVLSLWKYGKILECSRLRANNIDQDTKADIGADFTGLAVYLWKHWDKEQGGKRYSGTQNLEQPEKEPAVEIFRSYSPDRPPLPPKGYKYVKCTANTSYGYQCFHYVAITDTGQRKQKSPP